MKTYNKYLFIQDIGYSGVKGDCSDGYLTEALDGNRRIKLPHNNYTLLGIIDEYIDSPYAEEFSKEIVDYVTPNEGYGGYRDYTVDEWSFYLDTAVSSMRKLMERLDLNLTDYILRDDTNRI